MHFLKMQGAGNDFVLLDSSEAPAGADWPALAQAMCDRHFGVGADGLLLVLPSAIGDYRMRMWNPDGSEAEMCGNGIRCFARWLLDNRVAGRSELRVETGASLLEVKRRPEDGWLQVSLGEPALAAADIPVMAASSPVLDLALPELGLCVTCVGLGNPHAVCFVSNAARFDLAAVGPQVEHHRLFPNRANFHVCQLVSSEELIMRSWERGAGLTLACGTGAAATAVAAHLHGKIADRVRVQVPGGTLEVSWSGQGSASMAGPAEYVFQGDWHGQRSR